MPNPASGAVQMGGDWTELWFASPDANAIARLRSDGSIEDIPLPTPNSRPLAVARESWSSGWVVFTEVGANRIGVRFSTGELHEFDIPTAASDPRGITAPGPVYFTEYAGKRVPLE